LFFFLSVALHFGAKSTIRTLTYQHQGAGKHELSWDGRDQFGGEMPVGMYIYELSFDGKKEQGKLFKIR